MERIEPKHALSATDLSNFVGCRHRVALNLAAAPGRLEDSTWVDPMVSALRERGREQERLYLDSLVDRGVLIFPRHRGHIAKRLCPSSRTQPVNGSRA